MAKAMIVGLMAISFSVTGQDVHVTHAMASDPAAIEAVLHTYSSAVEQRDEQRFMSIMLDDQVPLFSLNNVPSQNPSLKSHDMHILPSLLNFFFHSKDHYTVTFDHFSVRQDHSMADVYTHFVTHTLPYGPSMGGWKSIQLVKVGDQWKIASELYTIEPPENH